ncbi:MAG: hypothetical protein ACLFU4_08760 [Opitutales bacterium]
MSSSKPTSSTQGKIDSSISFDEEEAPSLLSISVDAVAAAVTIAFTVLLAVDVTPFL